MRFSIYQDSLLGSRKSNQDRMGYSFTRDTLLMIVADGMGGHLRGEVAAQITLKTVAAAFQIAARPSLADPAGFLDMSLRRAHREILRFQELHHLPESPRTTVVACVIQHGFAWWAHAGDSRLYWVRDGECVMRTEDHSKVQSLVNMGLITKAEQENHPERNKVLNCLGSPFDPMVELSGAHELERGDRMLLCSDGVWSAMSDPEVCRAISAAPLVTSVPALVQEAVSTEGPSADNATAVAVHWEGDDDESDLSSLLVPDGAVTTTIAVGLDDVDDKVEITEDEIEQTIREIREAIEKTGGQ